jgi:hypothetical protein
MDTALYLQMRRARDDQEESAVRFRRCLTVAAVVVAAHIIGPVALAQDPVPPEKIVISLQADPLKDQEPACVALQLGTGLIVNGGADVTIFATLDGVGIANADVMESRQLLRGRSKYCERVDRNGQFLEPLPLPDILDIYLDAGGKVLACPLCWVARFGELPGSLAELISYNDQIYVGSPVSLLIEADKVIDY